MFGFEEVTGAGGRDGVILGYIRFHLLFLFLFLLNQLLPVARRPPFFFGGIEVDDVSEGN